MSAHTQDVLGDSARRALDAAAGITAKRPKITSKRVRTIRPGRNSAASETGTAVRSEVKPATRRAARLQSRMDSVAGGSVAASKDATMTLSAAALAPIAGALKLPEWAKASPAQVVLAGRRIRLGNRAFFLSIVGVLTGILALLLVINTTLAAGTFELQTAREQMRELALKEQLLSNQLSQVESPVGLENKAKAMGMVAAGTSAFIDLNTNSVIGEAEAAQIPMTYASDKKKKKKEKAEATGAASDAAVAPGTVDPTTGFLIPEAGASTSDSDSGSGLRPLGILGN